MMSESQDKNIVIVGGGMVGISLALLLDKLHQEDSAVSIALIEKNALPQKDKAALQPSFDDRSTALSAGSVSILKSIDCWEDIKNAAEKIQTIEVSDKGHFGSTTLSASDNNVDALGYVVENRLLGSSLLNALENSKINCLMPAEVLACQPKKSGYQIKVNSIKVQDPSEILMIDASLLIIADGAESQLRKSLGIDAESKDYHQVALISNVTLEKPHHNIAYERFTDEGPIALLPLPDLDGKHRASLIWTLSEDHQEHIKALSESQMLKLLSQRFGQRAGKITSIGQCSFYPLKLIQACEQVRSHLVIMGNAAHFLHPVAGQGFNLALRDCRALYQCLTNTDGSETVFGCYQQLKQYLEEQESDQHTTITLTDQVVKLFSTQKYPMAVLRQLGLIGLHHLPPLKSTFSQKMMGL